MTEQPDSMNGPIEWTEDGELRSYDEVQASGGPVDEWEYLAYSEHGSTIRMAALDTWAALCEDVNEMPAVKLRCPARHPLFTVHAFGMVGQMPTLEISKRFRGTATDARPFSQVDEDGPLTSIHDTERVLIHCEKCGPGRPTSMKFDALLALYADAARAGKGVLTLGD